MSCLTQEKATHDPYFLAWFPLLALAIANGTLRQFCFLKLMPELRAHQLSTLTLALFTGAYIGVLFRKLPPESEMQAIGIGLLWLVLTVGFEFFLGMVISKRPLAQLLADYNLGAGRVWPLYLLWLGLAPWVMYRMR